jgi:translation initiation factor IF-2
LRPPGPGAHPLPLAGKRQRHLLGAGGAALGGRRHGQPVPAAHRPGGDGPIPRKRHRPAGGHRRALQRPGRGRRAAHAGRQKRARHRHGRVRTGARPRRLGAGQRGRRPQPAVARRRRRHGRAPQRRRAVGRAQQGIRRLGLQPAPVRRHRRPGAHPAKEQFRRHGAEPGPPDPPRRQLPRQPARSGRGIAQRRLRRGAPAPAC